MEMLQTLIHLSLTSPNVATVFSFIGITDTNFDAEMCNLYNVPGFISEYSNKMAGKSKKAEWVYA